MSFIPHDTSKHGLKMGDRVRNKFMLKNLKGKFTKGHEFKIAYLQPNQLILLIDDENRNAYAIPEEIEKI